ncbi:phage tail protein [Pseudomonas kilonensis]|jgi:microcystin-dependent protein|uniref:phage tail protein n=1 Tax=Pseudomonas TaxID=286 RepID=UPI0020A04FDB|nr:tail fiber protein [Pseudomonas kilonensis]MCP1454523.1 microcystin-dependent protein [Pseudomonas kilonensis]
MDYPKSVPSVGLVNGKFVDENPVTGAPGSLIPAAWGNSVTQELLGVITGAGMVPDETDLGQLLLAVRKINQSGLVDYALDTGTANAYSATYKPAPLALVDGLILRFKAARANTGASTFAPNGLQAKPIVGLDHNAIQSGEVAVGGDVWVQWNSTIGSGAWVMIASTGMTKDSGSDVGDIKVVATAEPPQGWLKCNGALVSRAQYAALFAAISTRFGAGDGSTTFALPDLRGEFIRGWDDGRGVDSGRVLGTAQAGQNASHIHTATASNVGSHTHTLSATAEINGTHTHTLSAAAASSGAHTHTLSGSTDSAGAHAHNANIGGFGDIGTGANSNSIVGNTAGTQSARPFIPSAGDHTHSISGTAASAGAHTHTVTASAAPAGDHTHTISAAAASAGDHAHLITVAASGGNETRPRNVALLYVIKY